MCLAKLPMPPAETASRFVEVVEHQTVNAGNGGEGGGDAGERLRHQIIFLGPAGGRTWNCAGDVVASAPFGGVSVWRGAGTYEALSSQPFPNVSGRRAQSL